MRKILCGQITAFQQGLKNAAFIEQTAGMWKVFDAEIHNFYAEGVVLVVHAGVGDEKIELFIPGADAGGALKSSKRLLGLAIADIRLGQKIIDASRGIRGAAESGEDARSLSRTGWCRSNRGRG